MLHIVLHVIVPFLIALIFYRSRWKWTFFLLLSTMLVDVDHLLADPVYDPNRCSINFHPFHTTDAILLYVIIYLTPFFFISRESRQKSWVKILDAFQLIGLGLIIHMSLDWLDCLT